jgi:hypothetical protein
MKIGGSISIGILLAFFAAIPAGAQSRPNGFYLTSPLKFSSGFDDNFVVNSSALDDSVTLLTGPTLDWIRSTHKTSFSLDYRPEVEFFTNHPGLDTFNQASTMRFSRTINSRTSFDAGNSFLSTMDSSSELQNSLVLLPYGRFLQNTFYADVRYRINHATKLTFRFDNAVTTMDLPGALKGRLDEVGSAGTVTLDRDLTSRQVLSANYSFLHVDALNPKTGGSPTNVNLLMLAYSYQITPTMLVRGAAGAVSGSESAFNGALAIEKQWGGMWFAAGYQRYLGFFGGFVPLHRTSADIPFANGLDANSVYQVVSLRASGQLSRCWGLEGVAQKAFNTIDSRGLAVRSLIGQLRVSYKLNRRFVLFLRAEHYGQNVSQFSDQALSRNRYLGGVEVVLSRPPEREGTRDRRGNAPQDPGEPKQSDRQSPEER